MNDRFVVNRRSGKDRRANRGFTLKSLFIYGRREEIRRQEDRREIFLVDRYSSALFAAIVLILFLSVIDALLTLILIGHGAKEINPLMAYLLEIEPKIFMMVKYLLTCTSLVIFLVFRNIFLQSIKIYSRALFSIFICVFVTVIVWELFLICRVVIFGEN
ncbi:MAG: hypothetical protein JRH18_20330 [Deltaproteobacteria bacterium]|nr:hypothetical protein [Deltaproteobacteria bacterium]MBW1962361.1 hypothetical protein [Deltaproteobacteria bacterium]MBW2153999.1 hypothetical protein [Deltaproteobacteria bacterium]